MLWLYLCQGTPGSAHHLSHVRYPQSPGQGGTHSPAGVVASSPWAQAATVLVLALLFPVLGFCLKAHQHPWDMDEPRLGQG